MGWLLAGGGVSAWVREGDTLSLYTNTPIYTSKPHPQGHVGELRFFRAGVGEGDVLHLEDGLRAGVDALQPAGDGEVEAVGGGGWVCVGETFGVWVWGVDFFWGGCW